MKFEKIVGFGDSWMWGDELLNPSLIDHPWAHASLYLNTPYRERHCFLGVLATHYHVPWENYGIPGGSHQSSIWNLLWWLEHEPNPEKCLVLVGHTESNRTSFYNPNHVVYPNDPPWNRYVHSAWIHANSDAIKEEWKDMAKRHTVLTQCPQLAQLAYQQVMTMFDGASLRHGFGLIQFDVASPPCRVDVPTKIEFSNNLSSFFANHPDRQNLQCPNRHPNLAGHELIAKMLQPEIDRVILSK